MANPVSLEELTTALDVWQLVQAEAEKIPPYIADDELTIDRFYERNKDKMSKNEARELLERLVEEGKLEKQERRSGRGGGHIHAYVLTQQSPDLGSTQGTAATHDTQA